MKPRVGKWKEAEHAQDSRLAELWAFVWKGGGVDIAVGDLWAWDASLSLAPSESATWIHQHHSAADCSVAPLQEQHHHHSASACLPLDSFLAQKPKTFQNFLSHQILRHMHKTLNLDKK